MLYSFEFDSGTGILCVKLRGHWTMAVAERYGNELANRVVETRRTAGCLRLIVDASEHGTQMVDVVEYSVARRKAVTTHPTDKVAVCASSRFSRNQAVRYQDCAQTRVFPSVGAARAWLLDRGETQSAAA